MLSYFFGVRSESTAVGFKFIFIDLFNNKEEGTGRHKALIGVIIKKMIVIIVKAIWIIMTVIIAIIEGTKKEEL